MLSWFHTEVNPSKGENLMSYTQAYNTVRTGPWSQFFRSQDLSPVIAKLDATPNVYPKAADIFRVFDLPPSEIKVVILGQDPYFRENQANGHAFSVNHGTKVPPSLKNIFKELAGDLNITRTSPDLSDWAEQGVFLLNTALSVEEGKPNVHKKDWASFTHNIIRYIVETQENVVFILWGKNAERYKSLINNKHLVLISSHPSPLGVRHGFYGSRPFSKTNDYLKKHNRRPINW